jgi:hypothetical protein
MSKHIIKSISLLFLIIAVTGCHKNSQVVAPDPGKAVLSFPAQSSACTTGLVLNNTQSSVAFTWAASDNTDSYEVNIKNLLTNTVITQPCSINQVAVTLLRNTPYSWYVVSKSSGSSTTTKSDVWKFYNAGAGTISHPPFPGDVVTPAFGVNITAPAGTVNLTWLGSDVDNDIAAYDVYFGTSSNPQLLQGNVNNMFLNNVTVSSGNTYYWKIVTKDALGNTSDSGLFQFKVN